MRKFWWWLNNICWVHYSLIARWARSVAAKVIFIMSLQSYWYLVAAGALCRILWPAHKCSHRAIPAICNELVQKSWYSIFVFTLDTHFQNIRCCSRFQRALCMERNKAVYNYPILHIFRNLNTTMKRPQALCVSLAWGDSWPRWQEYTQTIFYTRQLSYYEYLFITVFLPCHNVGENTF